MTGNLSLEDGSVLPDYDAYCLSNVPATILSLFGMDGGVTVLPDAVWDGVDPGGADKVVLFLFDGLGYREWRRQESGGLVRQLAEKGRATPITTVFPSTTSAALTTIATGLTPQEHSLVEWYVYLSELDMIVETLPFSPAGAKARDQLRSIVDPAILFTGQTVYPAMKRHGVDVQTFLPRQIAFSAYSSAVNRGTTVVPYVSSSDLCASLRREIESAEGPSYFYVYWSLIDTMEHIYGPNTEEVRSEAASISRALKEDLVDKLGARAAKETLVVATADHGQVLSPPDETLILNRYRKLVGNLARSDRGEKILPWGAPRDVYLSVAEGRVEETLDYLARALGRAATVLRSADAVSSGLFGRGTPNEAFLRRVGDIMILPTGTGSVWYRYPGVTPPDMRGRHGGLHVDEMTIPFAAAKASSLQSR